MLYGIDVIVVGPGAVKTAIWEKADAYDFSAFTNSEYGPAIAGMRKYMGTLIDSALTAEQPGAVILKALTAKKPRTRYAPVPRKFAKWTLPRLLPDRMVDRFIAKQLGWRS